MPLHFADERIYLSGVVSIEEAEMLCQVLAEHRDAVIDLSDCEHMHTAILQVLLAARPERIVPPGDRFLERFVLPALRPLSPPRSPTPPRNEGEPA